MCEKSSHAVKAHCLHLGFRQVGEVNANCAKKKGEQVVKQK